MITASLTNVNGTIQLPRIQRDFINAPIENAQDVETLSGEIYTDFVSLENRWIFNYASMTEAEYQAVRDFYDAQFEDLEFPLLSIPFFGVADAPARMYINDKNIWNNCGDVQGVQFIFRLTSQLDFGSS